MSQKWHAAVKVTFKPIDDSKPDDVIAFHYEIVATFEK